MDIHTTQGYLLTAKQVAERFRIHEKTVMRFATAGRIPAPTYSLGARDPRWLLSATFSFRKSNAHFDTLSPEVTK